MIEKRTRGQRGKKTTTEGKGSEVLLFMLFAVVDARKFLFIFVSCVPFMLRGSN